MIRTTVLLGLALLSQDAADTTTPEPAPMVDPTDRVLPRMLELLREGLDVPEPNTSFTKRMERETVFDGSYDWHSCVIAHWALLVQARWDEDEQASEWVRARLPIEKLEYESETLLTRTKKFSRLSPYDEAWFLMLLSELDRHPDKDEDAATRLTTLREAHEAKLLDELTERKFPEHRTRGEDGRDLFSGFYSSWLWGYLLLRWSEPISEGCTERLAVLRKTKLLPAREKFAAALPFEPNGYDFLWVPAMFELEEPGWNGAYDPGKLDDWPEEVRLRNVHILGRELCRVWPLVGKASANERIESLIEREDLWAGDFEVVSHWMPQYLFIGRWFGRRDDR